MSRGYWCGVGGKDVWVYIVWVTPPGVRRPQGSRDRPQDGSPHLLNTTLRCMAIDK